MEIYGHEEPIVVGQTREIRCSTYLNATRMEWFRVGVTEPVERSHSHQVSLIFDATNISLNGTVLKCRVMDVHGGQHEESITLLVKGVYCIGFCIENTELFSQSLADTIKPVVLF